MCCALPPAAPTAQVWPGPGGDGSDEAPEGPQAWEDIGGYAKQKRQIEEALLLLTKAPDVLARVLQRTRRSPARPPRPRAMLLYGALPATPCHAMLCWPG